MIDAADVTIATEPQALAAAWDVLWQAGARCPFRSPAWLLAWWRQFGNGAAQVACLWDDAGGLLGLLPLYRLDGRLLPIGAGLTDYQDVLLHPCAPAEAATHLLRAAGEPCDLIDLPADGALARTAAPPGWRDAVRDDGPCPVLLLGAELAGGVPAGQRRKLRMARHRAERIGGASVETAEPASLDACLDVLVRLHERRWAQDGQPGVLSDPRVVAFHRAGAPALLRQGSLRLCVLRLGGLPAAAILALLAPGRILFYLNGYDPAFAFQSPGTLLLGAMLEQATAEGRTEAHFLRGAEPYKYAWGARDRRNVARLLAPP